MGTIEDLYERKASAGKGLRWRAVPWIPAAQGQRGRRGPTKSFDTYRQAEIYNQAVERDDVATLEAEFGLSVQPAARGTVVGFAAYADAWAATVPGEWATRRNYTSHARSLAKQWPTQYVHEIDEAQIGAYLAMLTDRGLVPSTRNSRLVVLRKILWAAQRAGLIKDNPAVEVGSPKLSRAPRMRQITEEEAARAKEALPEWFAAALYLGYDSGLRAGEVCGLTWGALDLAAGLVTVGPVVQANGKAKSTPKNGEAATIPLSARAVADLTAHRERYPGAPADRVFREFRDGEPVIRYGHVVVLNPHRIKNVWSRVRIAADLDPTCRWHDLRHGCASRMARAGVPAHVLQALMRHQSITSTQVYLPAVSQEEMRAAQTAAGA